jgi:hypothetical protein
MELPEIITLENSGGDWSKYLSLIYKVFLDSIVYANLEFLGKPLRSPWHPPYDGKHYSFWHIISRTDENPGEEHRIPDLRRCERILWIGWIITRAKNDLDTIWCWQNQRTGKRGPNIHTVLYLHSHRFLIILREKPDCYQLVTAYPIEQEHTHGKLLKERGKCIDPRNDKGRS